MLLEFMFRVHLRALLEKLLVMFLGLIEVKNNDVIMVFHVILAVTWTRKKGLYEVTNFSHRDLILFFTYQPIVKIRFDRKCSEA